MIMQKIKQFMKSRKGVVLTAIVLFGTLFFAFRSNINQIDGSDPLQQRLLNAVGSLLEQEHYSPKAIDDSFSKQVFKEFIDDLDGDKTLFLQSDINALKKYETRIDDEIHGAALQFEPAISVIYDKRLNEAIEIYKEILSKPFAFNVEESFLPDGSKLAFAVNETERKERWRKKLKYFTLERYIELLDQKEKNKDKKDFIAKTEDSLELDARNSTLKFMDRYFRRIKKTYDEEKRFSAFINVITNLMDPHSDYYPPIEKRGFDERMSNNFYGIGATLTQDDNGVKIATVVTGGAAWKTRQIVAGDIIVKVGQSRDSLLDISGYETEDAVKLIRGNKGTEVTLTIKKQDGTLKTLSIVREKIDTEDGLARSAVIKQGNDKFGYIYLPDFYANFQDKDGYRCATDVAKEVIKLKAEQVKGIMIDLRFNGGGSLAEVVKMVGLFIKSGLVVQVKERGGAVDNITWRDTDESVLYDGPLTVMVNELSASASEIFAAAIQDYKRGVIIGSSSTYGKGTVQRPIPLGRTVDAYSGRTEYGAVTLTFQKFYRVNGGSTQLNGVVPDVIIPDTYEYLKFREKDNASALPWDAIPKADIKLWQSGYSEDLIAISKKAQEKIAADSTFRLVQSNLKWLSKNNELPVSLKIEQYRDLKKQVSNSVNQNNQLLKLKTELDVSVMEADKDKFFNNPDENKGKRFQEWLKALKSDMYIAESLNIVSEIAKSKSASSN
jgi:carboxyl-terminal processing protease